MIRYLNKVICLIIIIFFFFTIFVIDGYIESDNVNEQINDFKKRGQLVYQNKNTNYYKVVKQYEYEDANNVLREYENINIGTVGDIYISDRDPAHNFFVTKWLSRQNWIGHLGMVYNKDATQMIEIVGNKSLKENVVKIWDNNWMNVSSPRYLIMRIKGINENKKSDLINESNKILGSKYNYTFLFQNNKKFYCSSVVSHIYNKIGIQLDKDRFITTGSDIITNNETYIIFYRETIYKKGNQAYNIYFLAEE